ncbi:MAG: hypothetical protein M3Y35_17390 [Actinomycetota bacterium]|nr:hypothetical protein [Actinomycetota bacterium]
MPVMKWFHDRYVGLEGPLLVVAYLVLAVGLVLTLSGPRALGWILSGVAVLAITPVSLRVKRRQDAIRQSRP